MSDFGLQIDTTLVLTITCSVIQLRGLLAITGGSEEQFLTLFEREHIQIRGK